MISPDRPRQTTLLVHADGDGVVLHDPHTGSTHRLNGVARQLWELCDGSRDRAALAQEIAARFGIATAVARGDVDAALAQFRDAGLILMPAASARERELLIQAVGT